MTLAEFENKYYLHDSGIERIDFDAANKKLTLTIDFCFWWQSWHDKNTPPNGFICVTFKDVSRFSYDDYAADRIFAAELDNEILDADIDEQGALTLGIYDYLPPEETFYRLKICAATVEVAVLERYNP